MFKYINMPKLVAHYLKEFSVRSDGEPSDLYRFIFCLCLPFLSPTFNRARLIALAIAECTNSQDQIIRVLKKITGADMEVVTLINDYFAAYDGSGDVADFAYDGSADNAIVPFSSTANAGYVYITLNGASQQEVAGYLELLIPFYVQTTIIYQ